MKSKLNCHRVFAGTEIRSGLLQKLAIPQKKQDELRDARDLIRKRIQSGFTGWQNFIERSRLFEVAALSVAQHSALRPRFRMQGSFVYKTANEPAYVPPQDIDLDDGLYLPVSFITDRGQVTPIVASRGFFALVEKILTPLCQEQGWKLDKSKPTCVRIVVSDDAHIDLPLYAVPDEDFETLVETAAALNADAIPRTSITDGLEVLEKAFRALPADKMMLAHRVEGWKPSDPRKIEDWFLAAIKSHGEVLRRVCRYLKGWRDFQWEDGKLSSIAIMAVVVKALDAMRSVPLQNRDDIVLLDVANALPALFRAEILSPIPDLPRLDESWSAEDRQDIVSRAEVLRGSLYEAFNGGFVKSVALERLTKVFGSRVPIDQLLITVADEAAEVLSIEPATVAAPLVGRTVSG